MDHPVSLVSTIKSFYYYFFFIKGQRWYSALDENSRGFNATKNLLIP